MSPSRSISAGTAGVAAAFGGMIVAFSWWGVNLLGIDSVMNPIERNSGNSVRINRCRICSTP